jgi:hypothetical protein
MGNILMVMRFFFVYLCVIFLTPIFGAESNVSAQIPVVQNQQKSSVSQPIVELDAGAPTKKTPPKIGNSSEVGWLSSFEFWMSFSVLLFGLLVFIIEIIMVRLTKFQPEQTIKLLAVTLIVISTLFIITAGFNSEQIAPAMGLFGTIAGYMLGRASGKPGEAQE